MTLGHGRLALPEVAKPNLTSSGMVSEWIAAAVVHDCRNPQGLFEELTASAGRLTLRTASMPLENVG